MIETSNIYNILNYVLPIMNQCFIQINTAYIKSFMKSQKYLKKGVRVGIGVLFFVNFGNQKKIRVFSERFFRIFSGRNFRIPSPAFGIGNSKIKIFISPH